MNVNGRGWAGFGAKRGVNRVLVVIDLKDGTRIERCYRTNGRTNRVLRYFTNTALNQIADAHSAEARFMEPFTYA